MKKIIITLSILFSTLLLYTTYASSYKLTVTPDNKSVEPGNEVLVSLVVSDIEAGSEGINVVETTLEYDTDIIDSIEFIDKNNWKSTYNSNSGDLKGKLLYTKMVTGITSEEEIGVIKFKIKNNLKNYNTQIKLLQVTSNDGYTLMNDGDKVITLYYRQPQAHPVQPDKPGNDSSSSEPFEPANPSEPTTSNESVTPDSPSNSSNTTVPTNRTTTSETSEEQTTFSNAQTGDIIIFIIVILALALLISVVLFFYSKKIKKDNNSK